MEIEIVRYLTDNQLYIPRVTNIINQSTCILYCAS